MEVKYFVVFTHPVHGRVIPLMDKHNPERFAVFGTRQEAFEEADNSFIGAGYTGYQLFEIS